MCIYLSIYTCMYIHIHIYVYSFLFMYMDYVNTSLVIVEASAVETMNCGRLEVLEVHDLILQGWQSKGHRFIVINI